MVYRNKIALFLACLLILTMVSEVNAAYVVVRPIDVYQGEVFIITAQDSYLIKDHVVDYDKNLVTLLQTKQINSTNLLHNNGHTEYLFKAENPGRTTIKIDKYNYSLRIIGVPHHWD